MDVLDQWIPCTGSLSSRRGLLSILHQDRNDNNPPRSGPAVGSDPLPALSGYLRMLTARATTRIATINEVDSSAMVMSLPHGLTAETSVGLKAVAEVNERWR